MLRLSATVKVFLLALAVYGLSSQVWSHAVSLAPHYVYLAQSLLQRHVDLIQLPPTTYDLLQHNGKWFVVGSPMPSIMMLPFVALLGVSFSDVMFSVVIGAIDVALIYSLLGTFQRRDIEGAEEDSEKLGVFHASALSSITINESTRRWITLLFAIGTPFWYLASLGTYWFTAQVVVVFFALLAVREALTKQRWMLAGAWLACAGFTRPTALFLAPFFVVLIISYSVRVSRQGARPPAQSLSDASSRSVLMMRIAYHASRPLLSFVLALALAIGAYALYNYARFKSFTDFGYAYMAGAPNITSVIARYGGFNIHFLPCNIAVSILAPPEVNGAVPDFLTQSCAYLLEGVKLSDTSALIVPNPLGMSVFLVTPALLIIFAAFKRDPLIFAAWVGLLVTLIPLWLFHNTGSLQFGYRYLFDAAPMWIILLAAGMPKATYFKQGLIVASVAINGWGFLWMFEKFTGGLWWKF